MNRSSLRSVIRETAVALASPLLKSIVLAQTPPPSPATSRLPSPISSLQAARYRRVGAGNLFEDEQGWFRYSIRGQDVLKFAHFHPGWGSRPDKAHLWETICRFHGPAAAMMEEIISCIRVSEGWPTGG